MKNWLILIVVFFLTACGYKPAYNYTKNIIGDKIFVDVGISLEDPENSVLITDAIHEAVTSKFHSSLVDTKAEANSQLNIVLKSIRFTPLQYDMDGYIIAYKSVAMLKINYIDKFQKKRTEVTRGDYDFSIEANSIISDNKRFEAIKFASYKAIDEFISKVSIKGLQYENR